MRDVRESGKGSSCVICTVVKTDGTREFMPFAQFFKQYVAEGGTDLQQQRARRTFNLATTKWVWVQLVHK